MFNLMKEYLQIWCFSTLLINQEQSLLELINWMVKLIGKSEDQLPSLRTKLKDLRNFCLWTKPRLNVKALLI